MNEIEEIKNVMNEPLDVKQDIKKTDLLSYIATCLSHISILEEGLTSTELEREHISKLLIKERMKILELEERVKELQKEIDFQMKNYLIAHELMKEYRIKWEQAESRIKELREGIENFIDWATGPESTIKDIPDKIWNRFQKLLEEKDG